MNEFRNDSQVRGLAAPALQKCSPPGWAMGLRQIYQRVIQEPMPRNLWDLIRRLDHV
jgi:hypothetical protein